MADNLSCSAAAFLSNWIVESPNRGFKVFRWEDNYECCLYEGDSMPFRSIATTLEEAVQGIVMAVWDYEDRRDADEFIEW